MSTEVASFAQRLAAVGRLIDQRGSMTEVLVQQADAGFIVHGLELTWGQDRASVQPVSIVIEPEELQAALAPTDPDTAEPPKRWWS